MNIFKSFSEEKLLDRESFYSSVKDRTTGDNGEKLDGHFKRWRLFHVQKKFGVYLT